MPVATPNISLIPKTEKEHRRQREKAEVSVTAAMNSSDKRRKNNDLLPVIATATCNWPWYFRTFPETSVLNIQSASSQQD